MRRVAVALGLITLASQALAADYEIPILRGSSPDVASPYVPAPPIYTGWSGFYAGGGAGYGFAHIQISRLPPLFPSDTQTAPVARFLTGAFGQGDPQAVTYGGFIGYNCQWDDIVFSVELDYNHAGLVGSSSIARTFTNVTLGDGNAYNGTILASASVKLSDYGILRGRAGWAYENFLPYAMIGLAVGREEASRVTTVTGTPTPTSLGTAFVDTQGDSISRVPWGYSAGVGADVQLSSSVFLRAEYEFVQFLGVSTIRTHVSTVRGGAGFRF